MPSLQTLEKYIARNDYRCIEDANKYCEKIDEPFAHLIRRRWV